MSSLSIEISNFLMAGAGAFGLYWLIRWSIEKTLTKKNKAGVIAWAWIVQAGTISALWFAISRHTADPMTASPFNPDMYQWRWLLKMYVASTYTWGIISFVGFINKHTLLRMAAIFAVVFGTALIFGMM